MFIDDLLHFIFGNPSNFRDDIKFKSFFVGINHNFLLTLQLALLFTFLLPSFQALF